MSLTVTVRAATLEDAQIAALQQIPDMKKHGLVMVSAAIAKTSGGYEITITYERDEE